MKKSESIAALSASLAKAQGAITGAIKDADNPFFKSHYADLQSVWDAIREPLSTNGLAVIQLPGRRGDEGGLFVETILSHESGEWISGTLAITPVKDDPQGIGSAITYARRYALQAIAGVAPMDDDGEAAMGRAGQQSSVSGFEEGHLTNDPVPSTYWDIKKKSGMEAANAWLSRSYDGAKMGVRKTDSGWMVVSYGELETKPANAKPVENGESAATGSWKEVTCTFGKKNGPLRGKKLGELNDDSLKYLADLFLADGKKVDAKDRKMVAALAIWQESGQRKVSAPAAEDDLPKFNGPHHEQLFEQIRWEEWSADDFIAAMKVAKVIPENAQSFSGMSDETAQTFLADWENSKELMSQYLKAKEAA